MKNRCMKFLKILIMCFVVYGSFYPVLAEEYEPRIGLLEPLKYDVVYKYDLNNDKKKEKIKLISRNGDSLFIDGKKVLTVKDANMDCAIFDLDKKDKYADIFIRIQGSKLWRTEFYRYNGKKLFKYASGLYGDGKFLKKKELSCNSTTPMQPGNGTYIQMANIGGFRSSVGTWEEGYVNAQLQFKKKGNKMQLNTSAEHEIFSIWEKASGTMTAYNKPAVHNVTKRFTLSKGDSYRFTKIKLAKPYTFIQVQDMKTGRYGWIPVKASQIKIEFFHLPS